MMIKVTSKAQSYTESIIDIFTIMLSTKFKQDQDLFSWDIYYLLTSIGPTKPSNISSSTIPLITLTNSTKDTPKDTWLLAFILMSPQPPLLPSTPPMILELMALAQEWSSDFPRVNPNLFRSISQTHRSIYRSQHDSVDFSRICQPNSINTSI